MSGSRFTDYMADRCGEILDMKREDADSVQLKLTNQERYDRNLECIMRLMAPENMRLMIKIEAVDIQWEHNCSHDYLQMYDGASVNDGLIEGKEK